VVCFAVLYLKYSVCCSCLNRNPDHLFTIYRLTHVQNFSLGYYLSLKFNKKFMANKGTVHPRTGHKGPEEGVEGIALLFL
jgi:hypothetical protein